MVALITALVSRKKQSYGVCDLIQTSISYFVLFLSVKSQLVAVHTDT